MDLWELYSDDDEEIIEYINRPRELFERADLFGMYSDDKFFRRFRLTKETTTILLQQIAPHLKTSNKIKSVTPMNQLLCTLRFYATGSQLITCGDMIGVHESTACRIVHRVTHAIALLYKMGISIHLHRVPGIIVATAVLHNLAILRKENIPPEDQDFPVIMEVRDDDVASERYGRGRANLQRRLLIEGYFASL
ncbi:hypothetical protein HF086_009653 [Spodoptera exigua]|uniref:Nuclease HARBI1 n=1 Tax=Spodoptera exigua TaxID=7107 RepID=A0A922SM52_SPOEX|nr:hypothetical protein HF086_009653 [Spodoptera exigua]